LISALAAARSKHSARLQRKLKALGRDLSASRASDVIDKECCYAGVRLCAGFRTPALISESRADAAGVRKAPRHEIAVEHVTAVPRTLWGFGRRGWLNEFGLKRLVRSFCR